MKKSHQEFGKCRKLERSLRFHKNQVILVSMHMLQFIKVVFVSKDNGKFPTVRSAAASY